MRLMSPIRTPSGDRKLRVENAKGHRMTQQHSFALDSNCTRLWLVVTATVSARFKLRDAIQAIQEIVRCSSATIYAAIGQVPIQITEEAVATNAKSTRAHAPACAIAPFCHLLGDAPDVLWPSHRLSNVACDCCAHRAKYLADKRILHRDLKTQNIFLTSSSVIKLGDFGVRLLFIDSVQCRAQPLIREPKLPVCAGAVG